MSSPAYSISIYSFAVKISLIYKFELNLYFKNNKFLKNNFKFTIKLIPLLIHQFHNPIILIRFLDLHF